MTKQEKIKESWIGIIGEENFPKIKHDEDGFSDWNCRRYFSRDKDNLFQDKLKQGSKFNNGGDLLYRPKSLKGIETNNGWIKIESENDLPKEEGNYMIFHNQDNMQTSETFSKNIVHKLFEYNSITHYKPIQKPKPPIY